MTLAEFFEKSRAELIRSNADRRHPFRTLVLSTNNSYPGIRTVVKRKTESDLSTLIYTDSRSPKVEEIRLDAKCSLLFYHPKKKLQLIINGVAEVLDKGDLYEIHREIALLNPKDYSTRFAPGAKLSAQDYDFGNKDYFCLLNIRPVTIQLLELGKERHWRAEYFATNQWQGTWLAP